MPSYAILSDREGQTFEAELTPQGWICPLDGGGLGEITGHGEPRVETRCPTCGAIVVETLP
jgi:hypothetical protein